MRKKNRTVFIFLWYLIKNTIHFYYTFLNITIYNKRKFSKVNNRQLLAIMFLEKSDFCIVIIVYIESYFFMISSFNMFIGTLMLSNIRIVLL